jgi:hypothetical protein
VPVLDEKLDDELNELMLVAASGGMLVIVGPSDGNGVVEAADFAASVENDCPDDSAAAPALNDENDTEDEDSPAVVPVASMLVEAGPLQFTAAILLLVVDVVTTLLPSPPLLLLLLISPQLILLSLMLMLPMLLTLLLLMPLPKPPLVPPISPHRSIMIESLPGTALASC